MDKGLATVIAAFISALAMVIVAVIGLYGSQQTQNENDRLKEELSDLRRQIAELESEPTKENERLKEELSSLRRQLAKLEGEPQDSLDNAPPDSVIWNGHRYWAGTGYTLWAGAEKYCESLGGHLVTITSQEEQDFVNEYADTMFPGGTFWIGVKSDWKQWVTGEAVIYTNWGENEPDGLAGQCYGALCLSESSGTVSTGYYHIAPGQWDDQWDDSHHRDIEVVSSFICEWESP